VSPEFPPALIVLAGVPLAALLPRGACRVVLPLVAMVALAVSWVAIVGDAMMHMQFMDLTITPLRVHGATPAFATIFCVMLGAGMLFGARASRTELAAAFVYAAGALGLAFAGDWISFLFWWELMMLGSTVIIWAGGGGAPGMRYFGLHALGGLVMLAGIVMVVGARAQAGDAAALSVGPLQDLLAAGGIGRIGAILMLLAMLLNAAAWPLCAWLPDAYPRASVTGSVFLSAFTTKAAVFALIGSFAGLEPLIWVGLAMAMYGIVYAVLENNLRRVLAYSVVNQVGFMVVAVGVGTPLAIDAASAHAFAHIIYKAVLFMCAGWVIQTTGKERLSEMGGLWRAMPLTMMCCVIAALAISAFPMTSGFTTKALIDDALAIKAADLAAEGERHGRLVFAWIALEVASAGVFLHAGIKLPWYMFFARPAVPGPRRDPPFALALPMVLLAALCVLPGIAPAPLYAILPYGAAQAHAAHGSLLSHTIEMLALLGCSALAFFVALPVLRRRNTLTLDVDWFWRRFPAAVWREIGAPMAEPLGAVWKRTRARTRALIGYRRKLGAARLLGGGAGGAALVMLLILAGYLIAYLLLLRGH
jgi:multicomponent Na+:H+ antiporter subunit D